MAKMFTERPLSAETALALYFAARIDLAERELEQAMRFQRIHKNEYTEGRLLWAKHQVAALKIAERDLLTWQRAVDRYIQRSELPKPKDICTEALSVEHAAEDGTIETFTIM